VKFLETPLSGAFLIEAEPIEDDRGFFSRTFCQREFEAHGLEPCIAQCNLSYNRRRGIIRGLHFQDPPHEEAKTVGCTVGAIFDVIVDLRNDSPTRGQWFSVELSADRLRWLYVPRGFAHGFQTLVDGSTVTYQMSQFFAPTAARGIRWDDARLAIPWPVPDPVLSPRDAAFGTFPVGG
jgi:dTDP-4-dehydrorhamnose 3,5-epimerase